MGRGAGVVPSVSQHHVRRCADLRAPAGHQAWLADLSAGFAARRASGAFAGAFATRAAIRSGHISPLMSAMLFQPFFIWCDLVLLAQVEKMLLKLLRKGERFFDSVCGLLHLLPDDRAAFVLQIPNLSIKLILRIHTEFGRIAQAADLLLETKGNEAHRGLSIELQKELNCFVLL